MVIMHPKYIYKVFTLDEWEVRKDQSMVRGTEKDIKDGFIHLSMDTQVDRITDRLCPCVKLKLDFDMLRQHYTMSLDMVSDGSMYYHLYNDVFDAECIVDTHVVKCRDAEPEK